MHQIRVSEGETDPVYSGTMHDGRLSQVKVTRDDIGIVVKVTPAQYVSYRVEIEYSDGREPDVIQGGG